MKTKYLDNVKAFQKEKTKNAINFKYPLVLFVLSIIFFELISTIKTVDDASSYLNSCVIVFLSFIAAIMNRFIKEDELYNIIKSFINADKDEVIDSKCKIFVHNLFIISKPASWLLFAIGFLLFLNFILVSIF